jgi:hypothetical protein
VNSSLLDNEGENDNGESVGEPNGFVDRYHAYFASVTMKTPFRWSIGSSIEA